MSKQKIREWLIDNYPDMVRRNENVEFVSDLIHQYTQEQSGWVSVDLVRLNVGLMTPTAQYEGPDYYKGYHQAREDILSTLPPTEEA